MGVDSGLPDFRGDHGFWKAYPPYARLGLRFTELANPRWFQSDPELAWGFYGHRMMLYRETVPHQGFPILHRWMSRMPRGGFVYTSNVDGHFRRASLQSRFTSSRNHRRDAVPGGLRRGIFPAETHSVVVDEQTWRSSPAAPMPEVWRAGPAEHPHVRRLGLGSVSCREPAGAAQGRGWQPSPECPWRSSNAARGRPFQPCRMTWRTSPADARQPSSGSIPGSRRSPTAISPCRWGPLTLCGRSMSE